MRLVEHSSLAQIVHLEAIANYLCTDLHVGFPKGLTRGCLCIGDKQPPRNELAVGLSAGNAIPPEPAPISPAHPLAVPGFPHHVAESLAFDVWHRVSVETNTGGPFGPIDAVDKRQCAGHGGFAGTASGARG